MARKLKVDMTGVESFQKASEGQHVVKIVSADEGTSQGGNEIIKVAFEVTKGTDKSSRVYEAYPLVETALWKLKGLLQAIGLKADGKVVLDLDKLIGKTCIIEVIHEEYNGQVRAKISEVKKLVADNEDDEDYEDEDDEEEEDEKPVRKKAPAKSSSPAKKKTSTKKVEEPEEDEDEDEDFEDEEEEEEAPAPKKKPTKKPAPKKPAPKKPAKQQEAEDEEDWDEEDDEDWDE